ncbi:MAG: glucosyltransferase domain-containing protein [Oscillospiraceae bacterium]|nr:glucosyltransferase domain-containing protein [Oscillospiraceae bacterium]
MNFGKNGRLGERMSDWLMENKKQLILCAVITFMWGFAAHGYMFMNNNPSHDALNEFYATTVDVNWKLELGRFLAPFCYFVIRGKLTISWLIGLLSLVYIAVALFFTTKIFEMKSKLLIALVGGVMVTNPTLIAEYATYIHDADVNMLALLFAVLAAYLWKEKDGISGLIYGAVLLALSLGGYQSYMSVTITFIILVSIIDLLDGTDEKAVFFKGLKGVAMIAAGCVLYFAICSAIYSVTGLASSGRTNALDFSDKTTNVPLYILQLILNAYYYFKEYITETMADMYYGGLLYALAAMIVITGVMVALYVLLKKEFSILKKLLIAMLAVLMPLAMNITYVTSKGSGVHDLMHYSVWFVHAVLLIMAYWVCDSAKMKAGVYIKAVSCVLVALLLWGNVRIANTAYLKKDIEFNSELSLMTRVTYDMERTEGYVVGETVVMIENMSNVYSRVPGTENIEKLIGLSSSSPITMDFRYGEYFKYVLNYPIIEATEEQIAAIKQTQAYKDMPDYPAQGYMQIIDGILVAKMG